VMSRGVLTCSLETPLETVAEMMASHRVHCVVGFGDDTGRKARLWGLVSDLDLVGMAAAEGLEGQSAGAGAATEVVTVSPDETVRRAAQLMSEHGVAHLLVADPESDRPLGVVSTLDVARVLASVHGPEREEGATYVEQLMTAPAVTVPPEMPLKEVAALLVRRRISGVPVVQGEKVLGVLSEADILEKGRGQAAAPSHGLLGWILGNDEEDTRIKLEARTAGEAMSAPAVTIESWHSPSAAAGVMMERGVKRLPVLKHGRLVGIVSRGDLVRAFARSDAEIEHDVRLEVVLRTVLIPPDEIDVQVRGGEVTLRGEVDTGFPAELLLQEVGRVPGVVAVRSQLAVRGRPAAPSTT
jgi:CBS domain-containing protein